ncbi:MAG: UbiA family prenyltransferase [Herbinix sp.]|nr:UbiA family prenyltransferase [Herbinix sp.]
MLKRLLNYTEIKTKITSTFTFALTIAFLLYQRQTINWKLTMIFFAAMFLFDLTTTAINNYIDSKTNDQLLQFKRKTALNIIYCLFGISTILGLYLAYLSDIVVLMAGGVCFACGVIYTYGPLPISRQPLGEVFSGFFYGLMIPFILMYINMPKGFFLTYHLSLESISLEFKVIPFLTLILFSITPFCTTANIMLANNICDLESDIAVKRHTLPYYIGKKALSLFAGLYYLTYVATIIMVIFKILSPICLLSLLSIFIVHKNIRTFFAKQEKAVTFICSIKNFVIIMGTNTVVILFSILFS